jgi:hypothetical protein
LLNFTEPKSIYASVEGIDESHSVYSDMVHFKIGQFVKSLFENSCEDIYSILIKGEGCINEIYFTVCGIFDTF